MLFCQRVLVGQERRWPEEWPEDCLIVWMSAFVMGDCFFFFLPFFKTSIKISFFSEEIVLCTNVMGLGDHRVFI